MSKKKKKMKNRFIEDDPNSLEWSSSIVTDEDREWAEEQFKKLAEQ